MLFSSEKQVMSGTLTVSRYKGEYCLSPNSTARLMAGRAAGSTGHCMLGTGLVHVVEWAHLGSWSGVYRQEQHLQSRAGQGSLLFAAAESPWSALQVVTNGHVCSGTCDLKRV